MADMKPSHLIKAVRRFCRNKYYVMLQIEQGQIQLELTGNLTNAICCEAAYAAAKWKGHNHL